MIKIIPHGSDGGQVVFLSPQNRQNVITQLQKLNDINAKPMRTRRDGVEYHNAGQIHTVDEVAAHLRRNGVMVEQIVRLRNPNVK